MARTPSNMLPLETIAPDFKLLDTISNQQISLANARGENGTVVMFICNHCPFVIHVNEEIVKIANKYSSQNIGFIAISSNDVINYPQDGPKEMRRNALENDYPFPYLYDEDQSVAKLYDAACTPDFYIFNDSLNLVYRGQLDNSRPGNEIEVSGSDLREALDALVQNKSINRNQKPSIGCNIKWKN